MKRTTMLAILMFGLMVWQVVPAEAEPMGTAWTYQGRLMDANDAADGEYDFQFKLFDDPCTGIQLGSTIDFNDFDVINGHFTVELDFGSDVFDGSAVWLETIVADANGSDPSTLRPRIEITPVPYALQTRGIFVDDAGNVGIGTTSPNSQLHLSSEHWQTNLKIENGNTDPTGRRSEITFAQLGSDQWGIINEMGGFRIQDWTTSGGAWTMLRSTTGTKDLVLAPSDGSVGIGTTDPTTKLDVVGTVNATAFTGDGSGLTNLPITVETDPTVAASVKDGVSWSEVSGRPAGLDDGDDVGLTVETDPTVAASVKDGVSWGELSAIPVGFADGVDDVGGGDSDWTISGNDMYAGVTGNVGIGTSSPDAKLEVNGGTARITNQGDGAVLLDLNTERNWQFRQWGTGAGTALELASVAGGGGKNFVINTAGNVGIGTTSPVAKLEVNGTIKTAAIFETYRVNNWIPMESNREWYSVAMSADGTKQTAVVKNGQIYVSTDSGNTWTAKESNREWYSVAMSADGTKQTAVAYFGQIYVSTDSGNTWTAKESNRNWQSVAMSADGTKQTAVVYGGQIYVSTDSGNSWTAKELNRGWQSVAMSEDGTKQTAVGGVGRIYISTDSGNTWIAKESNRSWYSVAMSADGTKQTAVVYYGQIYVSTDSGNTWTAKESPRWWRSVAMSADGTIQTAVVVIGQIYVYNENISYIGVGIGTTNPMGTLDVNGSIYQRGVYLHADYVFELGYELESIEQHSEFMWQHKHLKAIPKAKLDENGQEIIEVGAHRRGIVEELEKAHIYIEQLHKRINELQQRNENTEGRLAEMETVVAKLAGFQEGVAQ